MRPSVAVRVSRVTVPIVMVGVLGFGVAAATWPGDKTQTAYPAPAAQSVLTDTASPTARELEQRSATPSPTATPRPTRTPSAEPSAKPKPKAVASSEPEATTVVKAKPKPVPAPPLKVTDSKYATASLNVRTAADFDAEVVDVVSVGDKVSVTAAVRNGFRFISYNDRGRWISDKYLSDSKPVVKSSPSDSSGSGGSSSSGVSAAACSKSSSIQSGLTPNAIKVYRALCARYSAISSFGGRRPGDSGFHGTGRALDVMISNSSVGWEIAEWTRANAGSLGVSEVIYYQKIWTVERSSEGWRPMSDRGSASANHYDHVHVSVY